MLDIEIKKFKQKHKVFFYHKNKIDNDIKKYGTILAEHRASQTIMRDLMQKWSEQEKDLYYKITKQEN